VTTKTRAATRVLADVCVYIAKDMRVGLTKAVD